jgi:hypothetical protein
MEGSWGLPAAEAQLLTGSRLALGRGAVTVPGISSLAWKPQLCPGTKGKYL